MITPLKLNNPVFAGDGSGKPNGRHHRLGARARKAELIAGGKKFLEKARQSRLVGCGRPKARPRKPLAANRFHSPGIRVT